jgi:crotonobetainyl-CoA:carnitine CoA-transferase CaiB-like acyl-CoA transferase
MHLQNRMILDCSSLLPGPFVGKLLLQKGARVIKIENPTHPDRAKSMSNYYADLNEGKEIIFLDLTAPHDRNQFVNLVKNADGLIEGFRPKTKMKLGLDAPSLHKINPKLCIASLTGYPEEGPWKDRAGHDLNFGAVTGCLSLFQEMPALPLADLFAAFYGAFSLVAALDAVSRGAPGSRIEISMSETLKMVQSNLIRDFHVNGIVPRPGETLFSGKFPCYRIYTTADGRRVTLGAIEAKFWQKVCQILGTSHLVDEGYAIGNRGSEVIAEIQAAFQKKTWHEWAPLFDSADCCVEPVLDYSEVYSSGL